ncbi:MAG: 23S rRNA (adenine(2503)-C(2))-methyltransferase RlmN [Planctomycetota bacterium]
MATSSAHLPGLADLGAKELEAWCREHDLPAYRAAQIRRWIFARRAADFEAMTDLPKTLRAALGEAFQVFTTRVASHHRAADESEKLLLELADGERIECVVLRNDRNHCAACLSSQVGCGMHCAFCATGIDGVVRNLMRGEIIEQALQLQRLLGPDERLSHVVVMGMGEPLANLDNVVAALDVIRSELEISARRITVSTVGLPKGIRRLADTDCQYHLAVSLHAPADDLRNRLVPANRGVGIAEVLAAADYYFERTGRRVTYEYVLLAGENDQPEHARGLVRLLAGRPSLVNLIPYNPVRGVALATPSAATVEEFARILERGGLTVEVRRRKGDEIDAACGQLRRQMRI